MCYTIKNKKTMDDCSPHPEAEVDLVWKQSRELPPQVQVGPPCSLPKPKPSWGLVYCNDGFQVGLGWVGYLSLIRESHAMKSPCGKLNHSTFNSCALKSSSKSLEWSPSPHHRHTGHWKSSSSHHQPTMYLYRHTGPLWVPPSPKLAIAVAAHRPQSARLKDLFAILAVKRSKLKRDNNFCSMS